MKNEIVLKNCQIVLCSGTSFLSNKIKEVTKSKYSHVGLIIVVKTADLEIPFIVEAIQDGICVIPFNQYFQNYQNTGKQYKGDLYIGEFIGRIDDETETKMVEYAISQVGVEYDNSSIIKQAFNEWFGMSLEDKDSHRLICSEFVFNCWKNAAGLEINKGDHGYCTPASIGTDTRFTKKKIKAVIFEGKVVGYEQI